MSIGSEMRCPKCNKYLPDRCTCNGPSAEDRRAAPIAAQLDQDAVLMSDIRNTAAKYGHDLGDVCILEIVQEVRRAEPVAAQLDAELPLPQLPLPKPHMRLMEVEGSDDYPVFLTAQVQAFAQGYARQVVAPYAERIRLLEHEKAELSTKLKQAEEEIKVGDQLLEQRNRVLKAIPGCSAHGDQCIPHALEWIDGRTAGTAPEGYVLVPRKLPPEVVDAIASASYDLDDTAREIIREDWACSLAIINEFAAAPSPQENTNG